MGTVNSGKTDGIFTSLLFYYLFIEEDQLCTVCQSHLEEGQTFAAWPCPGGHLYHLDCILMSMRS